MSQVATYRDKRQVVAKTYAPGGCPVHLGKQKCGETQGLDIIMDFHKLYQEKMSEIDVSAGGDSLQEKVSLQEQWINDLTEQNKLLAKVIEELESETIGRVQQLEDKLNNAVKSIGEDDKPALSEKQKKIEEPKKTPVAVPPVEDDLKKKTEENDRLKQGMEDMRMALTEEIANKHDTISLLQSEIYQLEEKNSEIMKETSIKDDIIKELRKELKKSKQKVISAKRHAEKLRTETADKAINTTESDVLKIIRSKVPQAPSNSTVIFIHRGDDEEQDRKAAKSKFDSSDSSECGLSENARDNGQVHTCRSENDMKPINWMRPTKERSILTKVRRDENGEDQRAQDQEQIAKRLSIPRHIPVKTYVNNIEYCKDLE